MLKDVSFQVGDSEKVGLLGRNGSGKTTILRIISGEVDPDSGTIVCSRGLSVGHMRQGLKWPRARACMRKRYRSSHILSGWSEDGDVDERHLVAHRLRRSP